MPALKANVALDQIGSYVQGQSQLEGTKHAIKLSSNESSQGPSPAALSAFRDIATNLNRYPDGTQSVLRQAIAETLDLDPARIVCGNGSAELISLVVQAYVSTGDEALLSQNGFEMSNIYCMAQGAKLVIAPERNFKVDVDALLERITEKTRFCTIANPNTPTGSYISANEMRRLHAGLPDSCLLLIDNAYSEYVTELEYEDGTAMVNEFDNVVMTRTFSKIYGLSSLRIGWAYCPENVFDSVQRIRTPFNTNGPALAAASAAIRDQAWTADVREHNSRWLKRIAGELTGRGIEVVPSVTNFYLIRFSDESGKSGSGAAAFLLSRGIIPRLTSLSDQFLRITVGLAHENETVLAALRDYINT